ncbi:MAG: M15 family metallopeptidase [Oscillospiraceae bacterium]
MANRKISYPRIIITLIGLILAILCIDYLRRNFASMSDTENQEPFSSSYSVMETEPVIDHHNSGEADEVYTEIDTNMYKPISLSYDLIHKGELSLVNKTHPSTFPDMESELTTFTFKPERKYRVTDYVNLKLCETVVYAVDSMLSDFYDATGCYDVTVTSGYRDEEKQNEMIETKYSKDTVGLSEHHTGYAVDFKVVTDDMKISVLENTGVFSWIYENSYKYGLVQRYTEDKAYATDILARSYHFRYVGIPHAWYMHECNLCLEEYLELLKSYTFDTKHLEITAGGSAYEVYYIQAENDGDTSVYVPKNSEYYVSGNNTDGFIVTVLKSNSQETEETAPPVDEPTEATVLLSVPLQ